jgi:hypothetical protein
MNPIPQIIQGVTSVANQVQQVAAAQAAQAAAKAEAERKAQMQKYLIFGGIALVGLYLLTRNR